jgi:hypothetical protein
LKLKISGSSLNEMMSRKTSDKYTSLMNIELWSLGISFFMLMNYFYRTFKGAKNSQLFSHSTAFHSNIFQIKWYFICIYALFKWFWCYAVLHYLS